MGRGDVDALLSLYDRQVAFVNEAGEVKSGLAALREELAPVAARRPRFDFEVKQVARPWRHRAHAYLVDRVLRRARAAFGPCDRGGPPAAGSTPGVGSSGIRSPWGGCQGAKTGEALGPDQPRCAQAPRDPQDALVAHELARSRPPLVIQKRRMAPAPHLPLVRSLEIKAEAASPRREKPPKFHLHSKVVWRNGSAGRSATKWKPFARASC